MIYTQNVHPLIQNMSYEQLHSRKTKATQRKPVP